VSDGTTCDHNCACGHAQQDHTISGYCNACGDACDHNDGHYPSDCWNSHSEAAPSAPDPVDEARSLLAEHERQQDEACRAEIEQVLAKYGRKLQITQPQITIVPM
jgi:hypothetical protein